ncbi:hypothetical protein LTR56_027708 [Elasticomyces elasticus]|nr:hypothetical protein LTR56_027708 [Elasticomyces elasticus]KAK3614158.1 hypothetical protein LTR22_027879 [Elasticomyces elasticus]KAK4894525.1 hypothetical protein LTR49_028375 [Elasticomyces elasticus]KAK5769549.1 hypothetical protein LTS12_000476 [Elasticomyces elasticus]
MCTEGSDKIRFRSFPEGQGGTYTINIRDPNVIHHIGTTGLVTCVGVYCKLPDDRHFLAHINVSIKDPEPVNTIRDCPDEEVGQEIRDYVVETFQKYTEIERWSPNDATTKASLLIACPEMEDLSGTESIKQTGWYVARGVRDFFEMPEAVIHKKRGFIVDLRDGSVEWVSYDLNAGAELLTRYEEIPETHVGQWSRAW